MALNKIGLNTIADDINKLIKNDKQYLSLY